MLQVDQQFKEISALDLLEKQDADALQADLDTRMAGLKSAVLHGRTNVDHSVLPPPATQTILTVSKAVGFLLVLTYTVTVYGMRRMELEGGRMYPDRFHAKTVFKDQVQWRNHWFRNVLASRRCVRQFFLSSIKMVKGYGSSLNCFFAMCLPSERVSGVTGLGS